MTRGAPAPWREPDDLGRSDESLVACAGAAVVAENRARAARWEAVSRFHANRVAEVEAPGRRGFFALTPLQAVLAEFPPLFCVAEMSVQLGLDLTDGLKKWLPRIWDHCRSGRLDMGRAQILHDQLMDLTSDADRRAFAELIQAWFDDKDDPDSVVFPVGRQAMQRAARHRRLKFPQREDEETYAEAFRKRRVSLRRDENGMALLTASTALHKAQAVDYRLTLIAKKLKQSEGEERTIEQLRVDALMDLLTGRLAVGASDADLEQDEMPDGEDPGGTFERRESVGRFARPVINVTVSMETLMGLGDEPGVMAGGMPIPADLAREIATSPGSTWYRLLTDPAGRFVELSTSSYAPTAEIWRWQVARDQSCTWPGCRRAATECECDHRVPAPEGPTSTSNLHPLCRRHHVFKHSEGVTVTRNDDGSTTWTTRFGSTFHSPAPEYPGTRRAPTPQSDHHDSPAPDDPRGRHASRDPGQAEVDRVFLSIMERELAYLIGSRT